MTRLTRGEVIASYDPLASSALTTQRSFPELASMSAEGDVASLVLAALRTLRFVVGTRCCDDVCLSDHSDDTPALSEPLTWMELIYFTVSNVANNSTLLWLAGEQERSPGALLVKVLPGLAPIHGLAAAAPVFSDGRLPSMGIQLVAALMLPEVRHGARATFGGKP